jgi:hypothetical protein
MFKYGPNGFLRIEPLGPMAIAVAPSRSSAAPLYQFVHRGAPELEYATVAKSALPLKPVAEPVTKTSPASFKTIAVASQKPSFKESKRLVHDWACSRSDNSASNRSVGKILFILDKMLFMKIF